MTLILFVIVRTYRKQFKCNYIRNQKNFSKVFSQCLKSTSSFEHCEKKMTLIAYVFSKLENANSMVNYIRNQKRFSNVFAQCLKSTSNFEHFEKKDDPHSLCTFKIRKCE